MAVKKVQIVLIVLSIIISAGIGVLAFNVATQVSEGITNNAGYYSVIVGPAGSNTQLAMNSMYFSDSPVGTIPYSVVTDLEKDTKVTSVLPFAMADNYNGYGVVGTSVEFLENKELAQGEMFEADNTMQAVIGSNIAKYNELQVGDVIYTSHSVNSTETHAQGITIVGILAESYSSYDNVVFTQIKTLWDMHNHEEIDEEHYEDAIEEHHHSHGTVCAVLINTKNPGFAMQLVEQYDGKIVTAADGDTFTLQAIEPMSVVRDILNDADDTKYIVFVLCAVILVMNIMVISIITLLNMYHSAKEISLMRLIGISMKKINLLYIMQNSLMGFISVVLAFIVSRTLMFLMNDYVESMGVVLNMSVVYPLELVILLGVFIISVLPTVIWTFIMSRKDSIAD
jgi:ABC-type lipoprotein release transport system permease subunit